MDLKFAIYSQFTDKIDQLGASGAAEYALRLGFSAAELFSSTEGGEDILSDLTTVRGIHTTMKEHNLPVVCYSVYSNLWHNPNAEKILMQKAEFASELECPYLHHTLFPPYSLQQGDPSYEEVLEKIADSAAKIADHAAQYGVTCLYEDQGIYFNNVEGYDGFWQEMRRRCKNVGICADFGNILFVDGKPQDFLTRFVSEVKHVHIKDYLRKTVDRSPGLYWSQARKNLWLRDTMVGHGVVDFEPCMKLLQDAGYHGFYALELGHPEPFEDGVRQAMEYLTR